MSLTNKLQKWVDNKIITKKQQEAILKFERQNNNGKFWQTAYIIAGLLIGLGICLIIASNWDEIPATVKLIGDFIIFAGIIWGAYRSVINHRDGLRELYLVLAFLMVGATIGLVGQIFNLEGGWSSFALGWSLLSLPFVLFSRFLVFNICWWYLFCSLFNFGLLEKICDYASNHIDGAIGIILALSIFSYAGKKLDEAVHKYTLLAEAFAKLSMFMAYVMLFAIGFVRHMWFFLFISDVGPVIIYLFVFAFFATRMLLAVKMQNVISFKRNAIAAEIYIFLIFATRFGDLLMSGFGFILGGVCILLMMATLKKTAVYVKNMEVFK